MKIRIIHWPTIQSNKMLCFFFSCTIFDRNEGFCMISCPLLPRLLLCESLLSRLRNQIHFGLHENVSPSEFRLLVPQSQIKRAARPLSVGLNAVL